MRVVQSDIVYTRHLESPCKRCLKYPGSERCRKKCKKLDAYKEMALGLNLDHFLRSHHETITEQ